jgi:hypothetical protein
MKRIFRAGIGHFIRVAVLVNCAATALAQAPPLGPSEIGQIVDEVLTAVVPPSESLSRVPTAQRSILFDFDRTLAAFGYESDLPALRSQLRLKRSVTPGSRDLLSDCEQLSRQACSRIGWGVYVFILPVTVTDSGALVMARVAWADRGTARVEGMPPKEPASLVGFSIEVFLSRSSDGVWKFVRTGAAVAT